MVFGMWLLALFAQAQPLTLSNSDIDVRMDRVTGSFTLGTTDGRALIDGYPDDLSHTHIVVSIDGIYYSNVPSVIGALPLILSDTGSVWEDRYMVLQWLQDDIRIWEKIYLLTDDSLKQFIEIQVIAYNEATSDHDVGIAIYIDMKINDNDNPAVETPVGVIERDSVLSPPPAYWVAYEDIEHHDSTKMMGFGRPYGNSFIYPDVVTFGSDERLGIIPWTYTPDHNPPSDMAVMVRWEPVLLESYCINIVELYYGLPYPGFTDVEEDESKPATLSLECSPNPFNSICRIDVNADAVVGIYNIAGQMIAFFAPVGADDKPFGSSIASARPAAHRIISWNASALPSGIYLVRAEAAGRVVYKQIVLVR